MANGNPFYVQPADYSRGLTGLAQVLEQYKETREEKDAKEAAAEAYRSGDPDKIADFAIQYPGYAENILGAAKFRDEATKQNYIDSIFEAVQYPDRMGDITARRQEYLKSRGLGPDETMETDSFMERYSLDPEGTKGMLEQELAWLAPDRYKQYKESFDDTTMKVGAQEILEDGTIIQSTEKGPVVYNPLGEKVTGKAAAEAVKQARAEKVSNQRKAAGGKKRAALEEELNLKAKVEANVIGAKEAAKISVAAFDRLEKINSNISNIDEAIGLIDQGAETGVVRSKLPSVRTAAIKLDNLQGRLGLDIIQNTTFGALSEAELKFALDTALPQKLSGPELRSWLVEKKESQEKLSDYLEAAAIYLGTPGNTVKGWMEKQREKRVSAPKEAPEGNVSEMSTEDLMSIGLGGQ